MVNTEMLKAFKRLTKALDITVPEIDELLRMEQLAHRERLSTDNYNELMGLMEKYRGIICGGY